MASSAESMKVALFYTKRGSGKKFASGRNYQDVYTSLNWKGFISGDTSQTDRGEILTGGTDNDRPYR